MYREELLVGYRGYDHGGTRPRFPFGHGLGYTTWTYESAVADRAFARYDQAAGTWRRPPGEFIVRVGRSSADLPLQLRVRSS